MIFLKFPDEATAISVLAQFRITNESGETWATASHTHALDPVGTIHKPTGVTLSTPEGDFPEMAPIPGYHVNFIGTLPDAAIPYVVIPTNPARIFA